MKKHKMRARKHGVFRSTHGVFIPRHPDGLWMLFAGARVVGFFDPLYEEKYEARYYWR